MNAHEFVDALKSECRDSAVHVCVENFRSPPGRKPAQALVEISCWFNSLPAPDQEMVVRAMTEAANATLFGVLAVLDGARSIEPQGEKSVFHLSAHQAGVETIICPGAYELHNL